MAQPCGLQRFDTTFNRKLANKTHENRTNVLKNRTNMAKEKTVTANDKKHFSDIRDKISDVVYNNRSPHTRHVEMETEILRSTTRIYLFEKYHGGGADEQ